MLIKTALMGVAALAAAAVPAIASAQSVSLSVSSGYGRGYYGNPYGYHDYGRGWDRYGYSDNRRDRWSHRDRRHWDRGRHEGWRDHRRHDRDRDHDRWDRD